MARNNERSNVERGQPFLAVEWRGDWPDEVRQAMEGYVPFMVKLVAPWVQDLILRWDAASNDIAITNPSVRNRFQVISIGPHWLSQSPEGRWKVLVHEVAHGYLDGMNSAYKKVVAQLVDESAQEIANQWFYDAEEEAVSDLSIQLMKLAPVKIQRGS